MLYVVLACLFLVGVLVILDWSLCSFSSCNFTLDGEIVVIDLCVSESSVLCRVGNSWIAYTRYPPAAYFRRICYGLESGTGGFSLVHNLWDLGFYALMGIMY